MENGPFTGDLPVQLVIFHSYFSLPEGMFLQCETPKIVFSWFITTISLWFMDIYGRQRTIDGLLSQQNIPSGNLT